MVPNGKLHMLNEDEVESYMLGDKFLYTSRNPRAMTFTAQLEDEMKEAMEQGDEIIGMVMEKTPTYVCYPLGNEDKLLN